MDVGSSSTTGILISRASVASPPSAPDKRPKKGPAGAGLSLADVSPRMSVRRGLAAVEQSAHRGPRGDDLMVGHRFHHGPDV
jgi:hypothetical protein